MFLLFMVVVSFQGPRATGVASRIHEASERHDDHVVIYA